MERDVVGAVALPAQRAAASGPLLQRARAAGFGIAMPGQAWLNQLPPQRRGAAYASLPYALPAALDLDRPLASSERADYSEAFIDAQLAAGATLVTTPAHVPEREGGGAREQEVALVQASIAAWQERQGWRPPPQRPGDAPRELLACIAVRGELLPGAVEALVTAYAALEVDGFWLTVIGGDGSAAQTAATADLALGLQEAARLPVTVAGAGSLHPALLAAGVAAACASPDLLRPTFPPRAAEADGVVGIAVPVFHPAVLGTVPPGAAHDDARTALFATDPCRCGAHRSFEPPRGRRETLAHNRWCLVTEARDATRLMPLLDETRLAARVQRAEATRARLALPPLPGGWTAAHARRAPHLLSASG